MKTYRIEKLQPKQPMQWALFEFVRWIPLINLGFFGLCTLIDLIIYLKKR